MGRGMRDGTISSEPRTSLNRPVKDTPASEPSWWPGAGLNGSFSGEAGRCVRREGSASRSGKTLRLVTMMREHLGLPVASTPYSASRCRSSAAATEFRAGSSASGARLKSYAGQVRTASCTPGAVVFHSRVSGRGARRPCSDAARSRMALAALPPLVPPDFEK
jgi:hypothetical protein